LPLFPRHIHRFNVYQSHNDHIVVAMVYSLTYRRPSRVTSSAASINGQDKPESYTSGSSGSTAGIPDALSFDNIINNGTCPVRPRIVVSDPQRILTHITSHAPFATS
jgi:hypothetical protein